MQALEIPNVENHNACLVDVFDPNHARKVLKYIGQAYECLPSSERDFTSEHHQFSAKPSQAWRRKLKSSAYAWTLLAEMLKSKPWVPKTIREVAVSMA